MVIIHHPPAAPRPTHPPPVLYLPSLSPFIYTCWVIPAAPASAFGQLVISGGQRAASQPRQSAEFTNASPCRWQFSSLKESTKKPHLPLHLLKCLNPSSRHVLSYFLSQAAKSNVSLPNSCLFILAHFLRNSGYNARKGTSILLFYLFLPTWTQNRMWFYQSMTCVCVHESGGARLSPSHMELLLCNWIEQGHHKPFFLSCPFRFPVSHCDHRCILFPGYSRHLEFAGGCEGNTFKPFPEPRGEHPLALFTPLLGYENSGQIWKSSKCN